MKQFYTYLHCRPDGTPFYVGKGGGYRRYRIARNHNPHHSNILAKYGKENIKVYVFYCDSEQQAFSDEIHQISQLNREGFNLCNMTTGGDGATGKIMSESAKRKIGLASKGNKYALGFKHTTESKQKMSMSQTGRVQTEETKQKISKAKKGHKKGMTGKKLTEEQKAKIATKATGRIHTLESLLKMSAAKKNKPWTEARRKAHANKHE